MSSKGFAVWLLGIMTLMPLGYVIIYVFHILPNLATAGGPDPSERSRFFAQFNTAFTIQFVAFFYTSLLLVIYLVLLYRSKVVPASRKREWGWILLIGNIVAMPVFWFRYLLGPTLRRSKNDRS